MLRQDLQDKLRHNTVMNLMDGAFFGFGIMGLSSFVTIVPLYLSYLTESTALIGFMAATMHIGWQIPQLLTSNYVSGLRRYKPMALTMTFLERIPYFGMALVALLIPVIGLDLALILTVLLLAWQSLAGGFTATPWQSMISKIMPPHRLGTFFGMQSAFVNLFGAGGALMASWILSQHVFPEAFAILFLLTALTLTLSLVFMALTYEPASEEQDVVERVPWREFVGRLRKILRADANFRWFLIARGLASLSVTVVSFYTIFGIRRYDMSAEFVGSLTSILLVSNTLSSTVIGWVGDRWGHRRLLIFANILTVAAISIALAAPGVNWFYLVFALTGVINSTQWSTIMSITVQFGSVAERPIYIGMANTFIAPVTVFAPIIGGWLADAVSFELIFVIFALAGALSMLVYTFPMRDPRQLPARPGRAAVAAAD